MSVGSENTINGTNYNDVIVGTDGDDLIRALRGDDSVDGVGGNDYLQGGAGNDILIGGAGDDWLIGDSGNDTLTGGSGADQFRFYGFGTTGAGTANPGHDTDTITDLTFSDGDVIVLADFAAGTFQGTDVNGSLDLVPTSGVVGSGANIRDWAGLVDLVQSSPAVTAAQQGTSDTLLLEITNADGTIETIAIQHGWSAYLSLTDHAPVAMDDLFTVAEDATALGNILSNDTDVDSGDTLHVLSAGASGGAAQAVASDNSATVIAGAYGTLTIHSDGSYSYAANAAAAEALGAGASAQDVFSYTVADAAGATSTAQIAVTVTGQNDGPVATALTGSIGEDGAAITLTPNYTDVDSGDTHSVTVDTTGTHGHVTVNPDGTFNYDAGGQFEGLRAGQAATDTFHYTVTDGSGATSTQAVTITINGENDAPVAQALTGSVGENGAAITLTPNYSDADVGDSHAITLDTTGVQGKVTLNPDGTFSYDPNGKFASLHYGQTATETFHYTVTDGSGASSTQAVTVTIVGADDNPFARPDINGTLKNMTVSVNAAHGVLANDGDTDGGTLSVAAVNGSAGNVNHAIAGTYGTLMLHDDGSYSYTANSKVDTIPDKQVAQDIFTYTVSDGQGGTTTSTLTITVGERGECYKMGTDGCDLLVNVLGNSILDGGNGNDILIGGLCNDSLIGGSGNDILTGGFGKDTFVFNKGHGNDIVVDFGLGGDTIQFDKAIFQNFSQVLAASHVQGDSIVIDTGGGNSVTLWFHHSLGDLHASDFIFV